MNPSHSAAPPVVLIVEDSLTQAFLLKTIFERHGFQVCTADHGQHALEVLSQTHPVLVVSDIQMPEMDGYELCRRIKDDQALQAIPVVLLTSLSAPRDIVTGLESGADNYVMKPIDEEFLMAQVHAVLAHAAPNTPGDDDRGIAVEISGERHVIHASRRQILSLLLSTYETAVKAHHDLFRAHESLKAAQAQLIEAEKLQSVGRLAAGVAHEVRNPLAILEMGLAFLAERMDSEENRAIIDEMHEAMKRANVVITSLMELPSQGDHEMRAGDIHGVIEAALAAVADQFDREKVKIVRAYGPALPLSRMDAREMEQVFANLFSNALHAMPHGGNLTILTRLGTLAAKDITFDPGDRSGVRFRDGEKAVIVEISDEGTGIAPENLGRIFEPFFSTKPTGSGIGLGLTLCRKLIERHHGTITMRNRTEGGVTVTLMVKAP